MISSEKGNIESLLMLLKHPQFQHHHIHIKDTIYKYSALHYAAKSNDEKSEKSLQILLFHDANTNSQNKWKQTSLHNLIDYCKDKNVSIRKTEWLILFESNLYFKDYEGRNAFKCSQYEKREKINSLLRKVCLNLIHFLLLCNTEIFFI